MLSQDRRLFVCWTNDWQDNYLWNTRDFISVSREIQDAARDLLQGKLTWLAEIDQLTDVTRHVGVEGLVGEIISSGGEVGIHVHHTSVDPKVRHEHYRRAKEQIKRLGGHPTSYSAGMGNFINEDTEILVGLGICTQRSGPAYYVNACLPPAEWWTPDKRALIHSLFPPATHDLVLDVTRNPVASDWRSADNCAGYTAPADYRRVLPSGRLFSVPLGAMEGNEDGEHQLHIQPRITLQRLKEVFDQFISRTEEGPVFVACYFHPYDLVEQGASVTTRMLSRWRDLVDYQKGLGSRFLTLKEAKETYDVFRKEGA